MYNTDGKYLNMPKGKELKANDNCAFTNTHMNASKEIILQIIILVARST